MPSGRQPGPALRQWSRFFSVAINRCTSDGQCARVRRDLRESAFRLVSVVEVGLASNARVRRERALQCHRGMPQLDSRWLLTCAESLQPARSSQQWRFV